jgi:hypothetical protein
MKNMITLIFLLGCLNSFAQTADTALRKRVDEIAKTLSTIKKQTDSAAKANAKEAAKPAIRPPYAVKIKQDRHLTFQEKLLVTSPLTISVLFMLYFIARLKKEDYKLSDALAGDPVETHVLNPRYDPLNIPITLAPPTIDITQFPKSSSRLIAFFSGVAAIIIAVTCVSYFFYVNYSTGDIPDFDKMFTVILSLGIGITPYAFNKVATAITK